MPLISADVAGKILNSTDENYIALMTAAVESVIESYIGFKLIKTDLTGERITMPYGLSRVITPLWLPVNSVLELKVLTCTGDYNIYNGKLVTGKYGIELLINFHDINLNCSQWFSLIKPTVIPAKISAVQLSYNAGLYDNYDDVDPLILAVAPNILMWLVNPDVQGGMKSETFGSYSYTKEDLKGSLPITIAAILDGVRL